MKQRKILLIGKTGDGKSSAGNTILQKVAFTSRASPSSVTTKSVKGVGIINGRKITVIDTPGFSDTDRDEKEIISEIYDCLIESAPAVHAIGLVLKVGRYTRHENEVVQQLLSALKEGVLKHTVILFTFGEQLEGLTIEEFVKENRKLQELVDKCEGRCHVIDNKYWNDCDSGYKSNRVQVEKMLKTIDKMVKRNGCYTNEQIQKVDEQIEKEVKKLPPEDQNNLTPEEKREKAKKILRQKMRNQVAGAVAGAVTRPLLDTFPSIVNLLQALGISDVLKSKAADAAFAAFKIAFSKRATAVEGTAVAVAAVAGAVTGWKAAEDADSVSDAMIKAAKANYDNTKYAW